MSSIKSFFSNLLKWGNFFKIIILTLLIFLILHFTFPKPSEKINLQNLHISDVTTKVYDVYSNIPTEEKNIFKKEKLKEIMRLRSLYIERKKDVSDNWLFNFTELDDVCEQAFGAVSQSHNAMLVRGIMTANGIFDNKDRNIKKYKIYTPLAMGLKTEINIDLHVRYDDREEFKHINEQGKQFFSNEQMFELRILRENYLEKKPYITKNAIFEFNKLSKAFELAFEAYSPSLQALYQRGILTAHGEYDLTQSLLVKNRKYRLMTPVKMGLQTWRRIDENQTSNHNHFTHNNYRE